jgi:hypothetical protein
VDINGDMRSLATYKTKNKEDALKYAYAFMKSKRLNIKECSFLNPAATQHDGIHLFPTDTYSASYNERNLPLWESFKTNQIHISSPAFSCIGSLDKEDKKRVFCGLLEDVILFNCYGNYEDEAKEAIEDIVSLHESIR